VLNADHVQPGQINEQVTPVAVAASSAAAERRLIHVEVLAVREVEVL
jgi:hypothetical protein